MSYHKYTAKYLLIRDAKWLTAATSVTIGGKGAMGLVVQYLLTSATSDGASFTAVRDDAYGPLDFMSALVFVCIGTLLAIVAALLADHQATLRRDGEHHV